MKDRSAIAVERRVPVGRLLWSRILWRHWRREPGMTAMLVGILALGVAVFLAVRLANKAAVSGFGLFTESVSGESDFLLRSEAGPMEESVLRELRAVLGNSPVGLFPVLEVSGAFAANHEAGLLRFVGTDLVALQNIPNYLETGVSVGSAVFSRDGEGGSPLGRSDSVFVGKAFAEEQGAKTGERVELIVNDRTHSLAIAGILPEDPNRAAVPGNLLLLDLPGLQSLAGKHGELSRVEIRIPPGEGASRLRDESAVLLGEFAGQRSLLLETPEERKSSVTQMSAAFRMNLTILSGLALLVGIYLIMQAMEAAVVKRRSEIAVLRSLGVTPAQIRRAWLFEGLVLGIVGSLAGILLGRLLAVGLVGTISKTVNTLYYETTTSAVTLHPGEIAFSLLFGVVASVVAGLVPARDASMTPPAQTMRQGYQGGGFPLLRRWPLGLGLLLLAGGLASVPALRLPGGTAVPFGAYLSAMLLVLGASILLGLLFRPIAILVRRSRSGAMGRYAASQLHRPEGRHRLTAAGLAVAIGMSAAMAILIASFETTLTSWIRQLLKADLYIAAAGISSVANGNTISEATWRRIEGMPGVAGADKLRRYTISLSGRDVFLGGAEYNDDEERFLQLLWIDPPSELGANALAAGEDDATPAWISEPFSRRFGVGKGDTVEIPTPSGRHSLRVAGVYADYGNEAGTLLVARERTARWFRDGSLSNLALYLEPGADAEAVLESIRSEFPELVSRTNARLRDESLRIFRQTFAVTYALEAIAVIIAVAGLGLALAGLLLERRAELATLRALGATRGEIARAAMWEGGGLTVVGLVGGYLLSLLLGWVLIHRINPQSFGWTLSYRVPWGTFAALALVTLAAALAVSWWVGHRYANLKSDREE